MSYARSFNRFEWKYLVPRERARAFADGLRGYARADPHSGEEGYEVRSVYWDAPELTFFWEKLDGEKFRRKLRFRTYADPDQVFVEIKQRTDRTVQKRRVRWPAERVRAVFGGGTIDPAEEARVRERVAMEALFLCRTHRLEPRMAVRYRRRAYQASHEPDLRITFDSQLRCDARELDLRRPCDSGSFLLDPRLVVVEIKFDERVPMWLTRLVQRHELVLVRLSKYCAAVERELLPRGQAEGG